MSDIPKKTELDTTSLPSTLKTAGAIATETAKDGMQYVSDKITDFSKVMNAAVEYASTDLDLAPNSKEREIFEEVFSRALADSTKDGKKTIVLLDRYGKPVELGDIVFNGKLDKTEAMTIIAPSILRQSLAQPALIEEVKKSLMEKQNDSSLNQDEKMRIQKLINLVENWKFTPINTKEALKRPPNGWELAGEDLWQSSNDVVSKISAKIKSYGQYSNEEEVDQVFMWQTIILQRAKYLRTEIDRVVVNKKTPQVEVRAPDTRAWYEKVDKDAPPVVGYDYMSSHAGWMDGWAFGIGNKNDGKDKLGKLAEKYTQGQIEEYRNAYDKMSRNVANTVINSIIANATSEDRVLTFIGSNESIVLSDEKVTRLQELANMLAEFRSETREQNPTGADIATNALASVGNAITQTGGGVLWGIGALGATGLMVGGASYVALNMAGKYRQGKYIDDPGKSGIGKMFASGGDIVDKAFWNKVSNSKYASFSEAAKQKSLQFYELGPDGHTLTGEDGKPKPKSNASFYTPEEMIERNNAAKSRLESMFAKARESGNDGTPEYKEYNRRLGAVKQVMSEYDSMITRSEPHVTLEKGAVDARLSTAILGDFGTAKITVLEPKPVLEEGSTAAIDEETREKGKLEKIRTNLGGVFKRDALRQGNIKENAISGVVEESRARIWPERLVRTPVTGAIRTLKRLTGLGRASISEDLGKEIIGEIAKDVKQEASKIKGISYTFENHTTVKPKMDALARDIAVYNHAISDFEKVSQYVTATDAYANAKELNSATKDVVETKVVTSAGSMDSTTASGSKSITTSSVGTAIREVKTATDALPPGYRKMLKETGKTPIDIFNIAQGKYDSAFNRVKASFEGVMIAGGKVQSKGSSTISEDYKFDKYAQDIAHNGKAIHVESLLERGAKAIKAK